MDYNKDKIDEMVLALIHLTTFKVDNTLRAWKSLDWDTMERLHKKGYISDPKSKAKSVELTDEGVTLSRELFEKYFNEE